MFSKCLQFWIQGLQFLVALKIWYSNVPSEESIWSKNFITEVCIKDFRGILASSALHASFDVLLLTPRISFMNFKCKFSKGSLSFKLQKTPQTSLQYNSIGDIKLSKSFSSNLHGLFKVTIFFISSPDSKRQVSYCYHWAPVVRRKLFTF